MSRSIKKGPFVAPELFKRVEELNKAGDKKVLKTWSRSSTRSLFMTAAVMYPSISPRIWSATSLASLLRRGPSAATPAARPPTHKRRTQETWKLELI